MDLKSLFETIKNNNGATIDRYGDLVSLDRGYVVAVAGTESTISASDFTYETFVESLFDSASLLKSDADLYTCNIGYWFNSENSTWYVDLSQIVQDLDLAIRLGKSRKQLAIFDLGSKSAITL